MTTKEFIEMLQEADPSGTAHVRMEGGVPVFAELKEGYWDGPYSYIDKDDNYVYSAMGNKVDIHCRDIEGFVSYHFDLHDPDNWEKIKSKFKFELNCYAVESQRSDRANNILKSAKEDWDMIYGIHHKHYEEQKKVSLERAAIGWTWFQNKLIDGPEPGMHYYYTWKIYDEKGKGQGSNVYNTQPVLNSGFFERLDNDKKPGYYEWVLKK